MLSENSLCAVLIFIKLKPSLSLNTIWLIGQLNMFYHIIVDRLLVLCCMLRGLGGSRGSMVPNSDRRITNHTNKSQCSSHLKERMTQFLWNSEVFSGTCFRCRWTGHCKAECKPKRYLLQVWKSWALVSSLSHGSIKRQFSIAKRTCTTCWKSNA